MTQPLEDLLAMLDEKIKFGENLMLQLQAIPEIDGVMKLQRKIRQEVEFLKKVSVGSIHRLHRFIYK